MAGFNSISTLLKIAFIGILLSLGLFILGFATDYWSDHYNGHSGLWSWHGWGGTPDHVKATQAMECIGLILGVVALILCLLYIFVNQYFGQRNIGLYTFLCCLGAGAFIIIGVVIWGTKRGYVGWSFGMACAGGVGYMICGVLIAIDRK